MQPRDWLALPKDKRNDLVRRAQCDLLGSFRFCTDKDCRRARWCAGSDPRACKERLWKLKFKFKLKGNAPKTLRNASQNWKTSPIGGRDVRPYYSLHRGNCSDACLAENTAALSPSCCAALSAAARR